MAQFEKGNTLWKDNEGFKKNRGRITKEVRNSEEFKKQKQEGHKRYRALKSLKKDIFKQMTGEDKLDKGIEKVLDMAIDKGQTKQFVDLLKLVTPKELDLTSGGAPIQMGNVVLDGKDFELKIGDEVAEKEED